MCIRDRIWCRTLTMRMRSPAPSRSGTWFSTLSTGMYSLPIAESLPHGTLVDGEERAVGERLGDGERVHAGAGAEVDDCLGAGQLQEVDELGRRQLDQAFGVLELGRVTGVELLGHGAGAYLTQRVPVS